ncbi:MAG: hypothetical protein KAY24_07555, partial [Candidatus Eisenbacteria sp.]|nr:hypothetical protein [Candidatus Eisenbacteria bacterium]
DRLSSGKNQTELRKIKREMTALKKRLKELTARRTDLENQKGQEDIRRCHRGAVGLRNTSVES